MTNRQKLVSRLVKYLNSLRASRVDGRVTSADAQRYLTNNGYRGNQNARLSVIRSALNEANFMSVSTVPSPRPQAKGRKIVVWM